MYIYTYEYVLMHTHAYMNVHKSIENICIVADKSGVMWSTRVISSSWVALLFLQDPSRASPSSFATIPPAKIKEVRYRCVVVFCLVVCCRVVSCRVVSCRVVSCRVASRRVLSFLVLYCIVLSCRVLSFLVVSCLVLF